MQSQVAMKEASAPPATNNNPWLDAAADAGNDLGKLLKFVKGKYESGDDEVPEDTELLSRCRR